MLGLDYGETVANVQIKHSKSRAEVARGVIRQSLSLFVGIAPSTQKKLMTPPAVAAVQNHRLHQQWLPHLRQIQVIPVIVPRPVGKCLRARKHTFNLTHAGARLETEIMMGYRVRVFANSQRTLPWWGKIVPEISPAEPEKVMFQ